MFKNDLKSFLLKKYIYMINEFLSFNKDKQSDVHVMFGSHSHV
jgi:hypothetical protein